MRNNNMDNRQCSKCNEDLVGDGYTSVLHCPDAEDEDYSYAAPDEGPFYCGHTDILAPKINQS